MFRYEKKQISEATETSKAGGSCSSRTHMVRLVCGGRTGCFLYLPDYKV